MKYSLQLKTFLLVIACVTLLPLTTHAATIHEAAGNGLVGYWNFNEGTSTIAHDTSGKGNNGTRSGSNLPSWTSGKFGNGLNFTGSSSYVSLGTAGIPTGNSLYTISAWIKAPAMGTYGIVGWGTWATTNATNALRLNANGVYNYWWSNDLFCSITTLGDNRWHFILAKFDGTTRSIYIDGTFCSSDTPGSSHNAVATDVNIGRTNTSEYFPGAIDEVRIYNRALSQAEITGLYWAGLAIVNSSSVNNAKASTLSSGLVGWWTMDGGDTLWTSGTAGNEVDKSGNFNTGTLNSMTRKGSPVAGKIGQALTFVGPSASTWINAGQGSTLNVETGSASWSVWAYPGFAENSVAYDQVILDKEQTGNGGIFLFLQGNRVHMYRGTGNDAGSVVINNNQWYHITVVKVGLVESVYVNGVFDFSVTLSNGSPSSSGVNLGIGGDSGGGRYFIGRIDDVKVYNKSLSASEVKQLYQQGGGVAVNASSQNLDNGSTVGTGLVGLWTFNGADLTDKIYDRSGSGNNGYVGGGTATSTMKVAGKLGQGLKFNGSTSYVTVGTGPNLSGISFTISSWIKTADNTTNGSIYEAWQSPWSFRLYTGSGAVNFQLRNTSGADLLTGGVATAAISNNTWYHVVAVYNYVNSSTGTANLYINGALATSVSCNVANCLLMDNSGSIPRLMGKKGDASNYFNGIIDDVRIYNKALSASEVKQLYNVGK